MSFDPDAFLRGKLTPELPKTYEELLALIKSAYQAGLRDGEDKE